MSWSTRLVGRASELAELERERRRAAGGEFRCVLLVADPGVGKTRLAAELLARHCRGSIGLSARAYPLGATASFGVWAEALEGHLRALPGEAVASLCGGFLDDLAGVLRSVAAVRGSAPGGEPSRPRLLEGLTVLVSGLAGQAPLMVFFDDAHLADASSWEALQYLAHNVPHTRLLVILAARPAALAGCQVANYVLLSLEQEGLLRRLELLELDAGGVGELAEGVLGSLPPASLVSWLTERSGGNPLFALGLLHALVDEGADLARPVLARLPESLTDRVNSRLATLDEPVRSTLELLAVAGRRVELAELVELTGRSLDRLDGILADLVRARLVLEVEQGRELTYEIAHPLVHETIYQHIGGARRRILHRVLGRALLESGRLGAAAPHFGRSAEIGDPEAVEALREAVRQAEEQGSYREALEILGTLVELLPPQDERWRDVADSLSWDAEWVVDHRADAHGELGIAAMRAIDAALAASSDAARRAEVKFRLAGFLTWGPGELEEAERLSMEALELFDKAGDWPRTMLAANQLAYVRWINGDYPAFELASRQLLEAAEAAGDRFLLLQALNAIGFGAYFHGDFARAEHALRRSIDIARQDDRLYRLTMSLGVLGLSLALEGRLDEALPLLGEAKSVNRDWRDSVLPEWGLIVPWLTGDFREALAAAEEVLARNPLGVGRRRAGALVFAALSAVETGQLPLAGRYLNVVRAAYGGRPWFFWYDYWGHGEALLAWRQGRAEEAIAGLRRTARGIEELKPWLALVLVDLAEVGAESGDVDAATEAAESLEDVVRQVDGQLCRALSAIGAAWASTASGEAGHAAQRARGAIEILSPLGYRAFLGRAHHVLGRCLHPVEPGHAVEALRTAAATFDACGADWRRDRALTDLRGLGGAGRRAASATLGPASLTPRERDAVRLAAQGHTAGEIAERLIIGRRTVEGYLASAYAKLGVGSKMELVRRAAEFEL